MDKVRLVISASSRCPPICSKDGPNSERCGRGESHRDPITAFWCKIYASKHGQARKMKVMDIVSLPSFHFRQKWCSKASNLDVHIFSGGWNLLMVIQRPPCRKSSRWIRRCTWNFSRSTVGTPSENVGVWLRLQKPGCVFRFSYFPTINQINQHKLGMIWYDLAHFLQSEKQIQENGHRFGLSNCRVSSCVFSESPGANVDGGPSKTPAPQDIQVR